MNHAWNGHECVKCGTVRVIEPREFIYESRVGFRAVKELPPCPPRDKRVRR